MWSCWGSGLTTGSLTVHSYVPIGQTSKEGGAKVFEAHDWASTGDQQDQQDLDGRVHAAVHVNAVKNHNLTWS